MAIFLAFLLFPTSGVFADNPDAETVWMVVRKSPPVPDPALSDYPDCNVALTVRLDDGKSVKLVVPAFRARVRSRAFEVGDRIRSAIRPFDRIDATVQQFPLVGDDEDFLMERYYAERPEKNGKAEVSASDLRVLHYSSKFIPCTREERLLLTEVKKGISDPERRAAFAAVAARINKCWKAEKNKFPKMSYFRYGVSGNGVFSLGDSHHFADSPGRGFYERTIPALFAMNHHLKKNGIRFLVVLVPDRNEIAVRALCPELRAEKSPVLQQQMEAFEKVGIEIVSAWDEFVNAIPDGLLFCYGSDPHLEANGVKILAKKTAEKLRGEIKPSLSGEFSVEQKNYVNRRWEFPIPCPIRKLEKGDKILSERLYLDGKPLCPNEAKDSEVLVCGNSFIGYPGFFAFSACLARELRCVPYHLERQSVGLEREIPRMLLTVPDLLKGRRVCVMVVDAARIDHGQWLDISERDRKLSRLDGAALVAELKAEDFAAPLDSVPIPKWDVPTLEKAEKNHRRRYHYFKIQQAGKMRSLDIKLPHELLPHEEYIAAIPMWSTSLSTLSISGGDTVHFTEEDVLLIPIPAAKDKLLLNFRAAFSAALMGIGDIDIYRLRKR